jgi:uncharacterized membrane protein YdbT with pleckstrin-like domain
MNAITLTPSPRYLVKSVVVMLLIAGLVLLVGMFLSLLIAMDEGQRAGQTAMLIIFLVDIGWLIPAILLQIPYYHSLRYEIRDDEVIVHVGIWTRSIKHVPYRSVTNIKTNRDIFDRWFFNLGSLNVQTAGMSGKSGVEEALVGLPNVQEVYDIVSARLRKYRGAMTPTAGLEADSAAEDTLAELLAEVRAIRTAVEK